MLSNCGSPVVGVNAIILVLFTFIVCAQHIGLVVLWESLGSMAVYTACKPVMEKFPTPPKLLIYEQHCVDMQELNASVCVRGWLKHNGLRPGHAIATCAHAPGKASGSN